MKSAARPIKVSVVIPTYQRLPWLRQAVHSVFAQTVPDWELVIADDGSGADVLEFLDTLSHDPRVRLLRLPHSGNPAAVRNAGLHAAQGEYVAFLDSDDIWVANKLDVQLQYLAARAECQWVYSGFTIVDANAHPIASHLTRQWPAPEGWIFDRLISMDVVIATSGVLAQRRLVLEAGGFDEAQRSCEDYDLWLRMSLRSPVARVKESLLYIRRHDAHSSSDILAFEGRDRALAKIQAQVSGTDLHPIWRRERAKVSLHIITSHVGFGNYRAAFLALLRSLRLHWHVPEWWANAAITIARACTPRPLRMALRRVRRD